MTPETTPLQDVLVLDLSRVLAGPYCTMILGDLGADIIKIEHPSGDETRGWGPPFSHGESAYYLAVNRNKRSVTADFELEADRELIRKIALRADVLVENFLPGALERRQLALATLRAANPRLITLTISGMGASGPDAGMPGYDFMMQAGGGLMSITGPRDGAPSKLGIAIVDLTTGILAANAILAALYSRERTGRGQHIDISLLETNVSLLTHVATGHLLTGAAPTRYGNEHATIVPYQTFTTADGTIAVGVGNDTQWQRLCAAIETSELANDERFRTNADRVRNRGELIPLLEKRFAERTSEDWLATLRTTSIPASAVRSIPEVLSDPQVRHREMVQSIEHPTIGDLELLGFPFKFSQTPCAIRRHPPLLGEHNSDVRREFVGE